MNAMIQPALTIEREILLAARKAVRNPRLKKNDILEWAFGHVLPQAGEVTIRLDTVGCTVCLRQQNDKRSNDLKNVQPDGSGIPF